MSLTDKEKEDIIREELETPEGRHALAMAMVEPIRTRPEYMNDPIEEIEEDDPIESRFDILDL